ncbi:hypothetical protein N7491_006111 [Penicillium cf. griseofulvum]|uniref:Uncharacterized protein n=1 Tax=Penicillium cf. griseofulvum TaxID=2972120 RepID=A0A9W9IXA6_9EURO|nr:hypothetical protein N7472_010858 [Penicillium cf. griseofulvum]KAJ5429095.1 hypothetical protein N7491_006111 [Penicillium cf. griseofulvum]KAJ5437111.1 hypothetical protein N7445_007996 [Penicillium cf. griseofulvum]
MDLVKILAEAGAATNAEDRSTPYLTSIAAAADRGCWDSGRFMKRLLHSMLTTIYYPEDEFEHAKFSSATPTQRLIVPWTQTSTRFLLEKGADPLVLKYRGRDIIYSIANNLVLIDQSSHDLIQHLLPHLSPEIQHAYTNHSLHNPNSNKPLFTATESGNPLMLSLFSLGLASYVNKP